MYIYKDLSDVKPHLNRKQVILGHLHSVIGSSRGQNCCLEADDKSH